MSRGENWEPISNIMRLGDGTFYVGRIHLRPLAKDEHYNGHSKRWLAESPDGRVMFDAATLDAIFEMAHGAAEMMRPVV